MAKIASWVVVDRVTGAAVFETFNLRQANTMNPDRFEVVPILDWLCRVNAAAKGWQVTRTNRDARTLRAVARDLAKRAREWRKTAEGGREWSAYSIRASECEYLAEYYRAQAREIENKR